MRAFNEISFSDFEAKRNTEIVKEISSKGKEYILNIDEDEFLLYLIDKYALETISIDEDKFYFEEPKRVMVNSMRLDRNGDPYKSEGYKFLIEYPYSGSSEVFHVRPSRWTMVSADISVNSENVSYSFTMTSRNPEDFNLLRRRMFKDAFCNIDNVNNDIDKYNQKLSGFIRQCFAKEKQKYLSENSFFESIKLKVDKDTKSIFSIPVVKKRIIPHPTVRNVKTFSPVPSMDMSIYRDVIKLLNDVGKSIEKKPSIYRGKDEESLRDAFQMFLETRYEGITATGETFNKEGKTDLLLKNANDGSNIFVAECKIWKGEGEFLKAISQLFDRYLTWRDSKVALIVFARNKEFTGVVAKVNECIDKHPYFVRSAGGYCETSLSYIFHLAEDVEKEVFLEVILFHFPE